MNFSSEPGKATLIVELEQAGIKHPPAKIVRIAKNKEGKIIFLEEGKKGVGGSGLAHIIETHQDDFAKRDISADQIPDAVITAVTQGRFIRYQGKIPPQREIYEVVFNGKIQYITVSVSNNGYIVGVNPASI
ncbi:MAG: hypothetical protein SAL07_06950 [Oscillatoria sp. PMC 1051.18]|nr:hypothetical protein [Oscillatoria sp. PMC 1050.18]MEC5029635.1 hypothetical protein [Oscillatoria sp. PMC 1051.18]